MCGGLRQTEMMPSDTAQTAAARCALDHAAGCLSPRVNRPPVWYTPPTCPLPACGCALVPAEGAWKDRGDWKCNEPHTGKCVWFDGELVAILRTRAENQSRGYEPLHAAIREIDDATGFIYATLPEEGRRASHQIVREIVGSVLAPTVHKDGNPPPPFNKQRSAIRQPNDGEWRLATEAEWNDPANRSSIAFVAAAAGNR